MDLPARGRVKRLVSLFRRGEEGVQGGFREVRHGGCGEVADDMAAISSKYSINAHPKDHP
ncbi:MAG: hypothetical protein AB1713_00010 [Pseudomonadota bacterium]